LTEARDAPAGVPPGRSQLADLWDIADRIRFCLDRQRRRQAWRSWNGTWVSWTGTVTGCGDALRGQFGRRCAIDAAGRGDLTAHRRAHGDRPAADVPVAALATELAGTATGLAARFDARNGTSSQSALIAARLAAEPIVDYLPLSASVARETWRPATAPSAPAAVVAPPEAVPAEATAEELLALAERGWQTHRPELMAAALARYDERFGTAELPARTATHRLELRAAQLSDAGDLTAAQQASREAVRAYRELGEEVRAAIVAGRLGVLLCLADDVDEGLSTAREAAEFLVERGDAVERARGLDRLAAAHMQLEKWAEALAAVDRIDLTSTDDAVLAARVAVHRAHILEQLDRPAEFAEAVEEARRLGREVGIGEYVVAAGLAYARSADDPADAVNACDGRWQWLRRRPARSGGPGQALLAAGQADDALEDFVEAVALCVEQGDDRSPPSCAGSWRTRTGSSAGWPRRPRWPRRRWPSWTGSAARAMPTGADTCSPASTRASVRPGRLALLDQLAGNLDGPDNLPRGRRCCGGRRDPLRRRPDAVAAQQFAAAAEATAWPSCPARAAGRRREALALFWSVTCRRRSTLIEVVDRLVAALGQPDEPPALVYEVAMAADAAARSTGR
jgi:tetratricopeptide (TPR) repeat protein